jgi:hypothetical protein
MVIIVAGLGALTLKPVDPLQMAAAVAAIISLLAMAYTPRVGDIIKTRQRYSLTVTLLALLIVIAFVILPQITNFHRTKPAKGPKTINIPLPIDNKNSKEKKIR